MQAHAQTFSNKAMILSSTMSPHAFGHTLMSLLLLLVCLAALRSSDFTAEAAAVVSSPSPPPAGHAFATIAPSPLFSPPPPQPVMDPVRHTAYAVHTERELWHENIYMPANLEGAGVPKTMCHASIDYIPLLPIPPHWSPMRRDPCLQASRFIFFRPIHHLPLPWRRPSLLLAIATPLSPWIP